MRVTIGNLAGCLMWDMDSLSDQLTPITPMVLGLPVVAMVSSTRSVITCMDLGDRLALTGFLKGGGKSGACDPISDYTHDFLKYLGEGESSV